MIYILAYIVLGISTGVLVRVNGEAKIGVSVAAAFVWPLYWFAFVYSHFAGLMPAKCAWCGQSVGPMSDMNAWRTHYLDECKAHPLAVKVAHYQEIIDSDTAIIKRLEAELKPYREMTETIQKRMRVEMDRAIMTGESDAKPTSKWEILHG